MATKFRDLIAMLEADGWRCIRTTGSHMHFKHESKPGIVTVPGGGKGGKDVAPGTLRSILRQAGLLK
jgi:predicted RNA binding protein YcfA (HicA-like mRNA interferase family)